MTYTPPTPKTDIPGIGAYIFAGGFTIGMAEYFDVKAHFEDGPFGTATFSRNFPRVPVYSNKSAWPKDGFKGIPVIWSNPHCSPWSGVGRSMQRGRDNWRTDPNTQYARASIALGMELRPKVWVMESVPRIQGTEFLFDMAEAWMREGYAFSLVRHDPKFFGLPQQRRRCFMVAHKVEIQWDMLPGVNDIVTRHGHTAGEALEVVETTGTQPPMPPGYATLLDDLKPNYPLRELWEERNPNPERRGKLVAGRPPLMSHRLDPQKVSGTIVGMDNAYIHPFENRWLDYRELATLCGYPPDYEFVNTASGHGDNRVPQVAKAVTPPAGRLLGFNLSRALTNPRPVTTPTARQITMWGRSGRLDDWRLDLGNEPMVLDHECTKEIANGVAFAGVLPDPQERAATGPDQLLAAGHHDTDPRFAIDGAPVAVGVGVSGVGERGLLRGEVGGAGVDDQQRVGGSADQYASLTTHFEKGLSAYALQPPVAYQGVDHAVPGSDVTVEVVAEAAEKAKATRKARTPRIIGPRVSSEYSDLEIHDGDVVLDIGAHRGEFLRFVRSRSKTVEIFAYEADPDNIKAAQLMPDDDADGIIFAEFAVVANPNVGRGETVELYRCNGADTSMHSLLGKRGRVAIHVPAFSFARALQVEPTVVKIAVEGYEYWLLKETKLPDSVRELAIKFHPSTPDSRAQARAAVGFIEAQGFQVVKRPQLEKGSWPVVGVWRRGS